MTLRPGPRWRSLQRSSRPSSWTTVMGMKKGENMREKEGRKKEGGKYRGVTEGNDGNGWEGKGGKAGARRGGKGRGGEVNWMAWPPQL